MFLCDNTWKFCKPFNTLTLKQIFWKTQALFSNLEYHFLVETTKTENATIPYKTALSEANVKTKKGEYEMDLSQRTEFYQFYFFESFVSV